MTATTHSKRPHSTSGKYRYSKGHRSLYAISASLFAGAVLILHYQSRQPTDQRERAFPSRETRIPLKGTGAMSQEAAASKFETDTLTRESFPVVGNSEKRQFKDAALAPVVTGGPLSAEPGNCLKHVLYDKPVKTGSTAITFAIRDVLNSKGEKDKACAAQGIVNCVDRAQMICNGTVEEKDYFSIIGHLKYGGKALADCLRPRYYIATSIREPYQRRKSAYLYNRTTNSSHFAIPHTVSFREFMNRMPRCQLYHYYDGHGMHCDIEGITLEERIRGIVDRVDEVIDIYDEPVGQLHKLIYDYLKRENESMKINDEEFLEDFDEDTLKEERMLYERLRAKRLEPPKQGRKLC